jgi:hypothetical protein
VHGLNRVGHLCQPAGGDAEVGHSFLG